MDNSPPMSLEAAKAAWEADNQNVRKALAYVARLMAAATLGQITAAEVDIALTAMRGPSEQMLKDRVGDAGLAEANRLMKSGKGPREIARRLAHMDKDAAKDRAEAVAWAAELLGSKETAELARKFFEAGLPSEVAAAAIAAMEAKPGDGTVIQIISVGADGVATVQDLSSDENDGIGRPVGNA